MYYQDLILEVLAGFKKMGSYHDLVVFKSLGCIEVQDFREVLTGFYWT